MPSIGDTLRGYAQRDGRGYPDWATRYVPITRTLERSGLPASARVLEVGANENGYSRFSGRRVIAVDLAFTHLQAARSSQDVVPVLADASALPFRDESFDAVLCVETFEHLETMKRWAATAELARVLRDTGAAVITFPSGEAAHRAEETIREAYWKHTQGSLRWFEEHAVAGLPDPETIRSQLDQKLADTHTIVQEKNVNIGVWVWMWKVLMCGWPGRGNAVAQVVLHAVTPLLCRAHFGTCYRCMLWVLPRRQPGAGS